MMGDSLKSEPQEEPELRASSEPPLKRHRSAIASAEAEEASLTIAIAETEEAISYEAGDNCGFDDVCH